ncbi:hypothetical protein WR25_02665 [Diploscapter pachys]|uniref:TonB-dependent receptor n=2 Tax=cellular organisms TaxID=131567 RepID=A0A2A2K1I9_9BILA|nr:hypothetical protein WR25_02665 [Diploscapter pachys]
MRLAAGASMLALALSGQSVAAQTTDRPGTDQVDPAQTTQPSTTQSAGGSGLKKPLSGSTSIEAQAQTDQSPVTAAEVQTPAADSGADIVVTGLRQSLANAQALKRNADTVVDAITAEDIGALPDRSINEALQRVPGVAITRFASAGDAQHFSVEGSGVQIRGLTYSRGEFNGRDAFSVSGGREIGYNDVPAELAGSVEVFKNLTADLIEGGIAGTVSINTRKPFDSKDTIVYLSGGVSYGDMAKQSAPSAVGLFSKQWDTEHGRFGLLVGGSYFEQNSRSDSVFTSGFLPRFNAPDDGVDGYAVNGNYQGSQYDGNTCDGNNPNEGRIINAGQPYAIRVCDSFATPAGLSTVYAPAGAGVRQQRFNTKRTSITAAGQFESADRRLLVTGQFLRAQNEVGWVDRSMETSVYYNDIGQTFPLGTLTGGSANTSYTFDDNGIFTSGVIGRRNNRQAHNVPASQACTIPNNGFPYQSTYCDYPQFVNPNGLNTYLTNRYNYTRTQTTDAALNVKFSPTDRLHLNLDGQYTTASSRSLDDIVDAYTFTNVAIDLRGNTPNVSFLTPGFNNSTYFLQPNNVFYNDAYNNRAINDGHEWAFRGDAQYEFSDDSFLRSVKAGGRWAKRDQTVRTNDYNNWGSLSATWTDEGPSFLGATPNQAQPYNFSDFYRGSNSVPTALYLTDDVLKNHEALSSLLRSVRDPQNGFSYTPIEDRGGAVVNGRTTVNPNLIDGYFFNNEIYKNSEETIAGYVRADFSTPEFGNGMRLTGNVGVRYVHTRDVSEGATNFPASTQVLPSGFADFAAYCARQAGPREDGTIPSNSQIPALCRPGATDAQRAAALAFANGASVPQSAINEFDNWLPSLNLRLDITPKLLARFAASKAITRPNFGDLRNFVSLNFNGANGVFEARATNPYLRPIKADQLDLTAEWYFAKVGQLTGTLFYKRLSNVIVDNSGFVRDFTNNGTSYALALTGPTNATGKSDIKGAELSYQQTYDFLPGVLSGFGLQATYTFIDAGRIQTTPPAFRASTDPTPFEGDGNQPPIDITGLYTNLPLPLLSKHNFNLAAFYDKFGIYARFAYSWRSSYLLNNRDALFPFLPVYSDATGQADASLFYTVNKSFKIGLQVNNLLDTTTKTRFLLNQDGLTAPRTYFKSDRQFQLSVRLTY